MTTLFSVAEISAVSGELIFINGADFSTYGEAENWINEKAPSGRYQIQKVIIKGTHESQLSS